MKCILMKKKLDDINVNDLVTFTNLSYKGGGVFR